MFTIAPRRSPTTCRDRVPCQCLRRKPLHLEDSLMPSSRTRSNMTPAWWLPTLGTIGHARPMPGTMR
ncbi:Uncharacterized protein PBTT_09437 [Plasmodiophora brassicae]